MEKTCKLRRLPSIKRIMHEGLEYCSYLNNDPPSNIFRCCSPSPFYSSLFSSFLSRLLVLFGHLVDGFFRSRILNHAIEFRVRCSVSFATENFNSETLFVFSVPVYPLRRTWRRVNDIPRVGRLHKRETVAPENMTQE